jgi:hypothetical protein
MTTPSTLITSARYDLRDTSEAEYSDAELLEYLNRAIFQLDYALSGLGSDLVMAEDTTTTLAEDDDSVAVPANTIVVTDVWIDTDQLTVLNPPASLYYERKFSTEGQPLYWCQIGSNIEFERDADDDYDLTIYYDKATGTLASDGTLPYADQFNNALRQAIIIQAKHRNEQDSDMDGALMKFFSQEVMEKSIMRRYMPTMPAKAKLDF